MAALGTIFLCVGIALWLGVSEILANMVIGFIVANWLRVGDRQRLVNVIDHVEDVVLAMFLVLAGLNFDANVLATVGLLAALIFVTRAAGKYAGARLGARIAGSPAAVKKHLGLALLPAAGVTLGLALVARPDQGGGPGRDGRGGLLTTR